MPNSNNNKPYILIVDDQTENIDVLSNILTDEYNVLAATSGEKALSIIKTKVIPEVVLLDVMMPEMDGYEVCRNIKDDPACADIAVIFVSALDSIEKIISAYEAGGSDYVTKPVKPDEIFQKVRLAIDNQKAHAALKNDHKQAMQTAMTAITNAGEQGIVIDFMRKSFTVKNITELSQQIINSNASYGLESSVQIRSNESVVNLCSEEPISPLEKEFLSKIKDAGRLREKGYYFVANFGDITMLIKNMPDDDDKRGRLRDHLAILIEGAEARLGALQVESIIKNIVADSKNSLQEIKLIQKQNKEKALKIMDDILFDLRSSFLSYGLTEDQEDMLIEVVMSGENKSLENLDESLKIDEQLNTIITRLETCFDNKS